MFNHDIVKEIRLLHRVHVETERWEASTEIHVPFGDEIEVYARADTKEAAVSALMNQVENDLRMKITDMVAMINQFSDSCGFRPDEYITKTGYRSQ